MADAPVDLGLAERPPATPLYSLASDLTAGSRDLLQERQAAGERLAQRYESSAGRMEKAASGLEALGETQAKERAAARPVPPTLTAPPSTQPRAFLEPGPSVLSQIQNAILGVGQIAMGIAGLSGRGAAIGATAALKGAIEGWQAGDADRVQRSLAEWKAQSDTLLAKHKIARESFDDLLLDHTKTWDQKLAEFKTRAEILNIQALGDAAKVGNLDALIEYGQKETQFGLGLLKIKAELAHYHQLETQAQRNYEMAQERLRLQREAGARSERRTRLAEETATGVLKLEREDDSLTNSLRQMDTLEESVKRLDAKGVIPKGATAADKLKASLALQTSFGDEQVALDIENVKRMGTALLVGSEIAAGLAPSVARLKVIGEAEAAGATGIPKSFWDQWFRRQRQFLTERRSTVRRHLSTRPPAGATAERDDEYEIVP